MTDFDTAVRRAQEYFAKKGALCLSKVYEADDSWIFFASSGNSPKFGNSGVSICKKTGEVRSFVLPSKANFIKLKNAKLLGD